MFINLLEISNLGLYFLASWLLYVPQLTFLLQALSVSQVVLGFALMYVFVWSYVCCSVLLLWGRVCFDSCVSMLCHV